jgi:VCBS repeat-containing protein
MKCDGSSILCPSGVLSAAFRLSCQPGLGDGVNAIPAATYPTTTCRNDTGYTWTITAITCMTDTGTSTCSATNGAGTALLTSAITGSNTYAAGTQSTTTTIASGDFIKVSFGVDGTTKQISIDIAGTY